MTNWRNNLVKKLCKKCNCIFEGKYNSSSCSICKKQTKRNCFKSFKQKNPNYFKFHHAKRRLNGKALKALLKRDYGITIEEYEKMRSDQNDLCAICGSAEGNWKANGSRLVVDHCHKTKKVRGLLCPSCNRGLGQFEDDSNRLKNAITYLQTPNGK